jgi:hypothetical protein
MSVQQNHYVMVGHKFDYDTFYDSVVKANNLENGDDVFEFIEEKCHDSAFEGIHHYNDLCILSDGYNGEYVYVGYVLQKSKNYGSLNDYVNPKKRSGKYVSTKIHESLGLENIKCKSLSFTHYR